MTDEERAKIEAEIQAELKKERSKRFFQHSANGFMTYKGDPSSIDHNIINHPDIEEL